MATLNAVDAMNRTKIWLMLTSVYLTFLGLLGQLPLKYIKPSSVRPLAVQHCHALQRP
jgi:hypothetical protein